MAAVGDWSCLTLERIQHSNSQFCYEQKSVKETARGRTRRTMLRGERGKEEIQEETRSLRERWKKKSNTPRIGPRKEEAMKAVDAVA